MNDINLDFIRSLKILCCKEDWGKSSVFLSYDYTQSVFVGSVWLRIGS